MGASTVVGSRSSVIYQNTIHTASTSTLRSILSLPNRTLRKFSFSARDTRKLSQQLIATAFRGDDDRVYELLEAGADVNYKENQRRVAICSAASRGHTSTVRVLLENHARVDSVDGQGMTPLMWAVTTETEDLVELLCSYHAKLNKKDKKGSTALHKAASGRPRMTELLLSKNVDYNVPDQDSMRPINFACEKGDDSSLRLLVQAGADVSAKYSPPIRNCIWNLHVGTVKTLIDIGVSLSVRYHIRETDKGKVSALSHAACIALDESVKNYWAKDTLHDWTRYDKAIEIIGILRNAGAIARGSLTHVYGSDGEQSASFYYGGMLPDLIAFKWNQKLACIGHPYYYGATPEMRANILNEQRRLERLEQQTALSIRQPASQPSTVEYPNATLQPSPSLFPTSHYSLNDQSALFTGHFPGSSNNLQSPLNYLLWIGKAEQPQPAHDNQRISEPARGSARSIYSERGAGALDIEC
ncbi:unnamed protein product [Periconia digitata]|uniref:Ankyrin n=1 Tax=Periconia digitata TaxID=1303443 RepID=A0A9W4U502_9PLEO|nr:unnamed protein product [Periconia digitata]